jgi:hypothetical protein
MGPGRLGIIFRKNPDAKAGSRPEHVKGVRVHYGIFDMPPANQEELPASRWVTRNLYVITFRESDRGKRAYFSLRWEIGKQDGEGPWSEIQSELIP